MIESLEVHYTSKGSQRVGRLAYKNRKIYFEYDPDFLKTGLELSPFKLPLKAGVFFCEDRIFDGLFGLFNDSLPDGWGRLLLDRKLMQLGITPGELTPLDRLACVGTRGMGALSYQPEMDTDVRLLHDNLDLIEDKILQFQENEDSPFVDDLLTMNGSSAGARPKILVTLVDHSYLATNNREENHTQDWLIKFRSSSDPLDVGSIEYAYHLTAKASGLEVPEARLFPSKKCSGYFGVRRFDRTQDRLLHMHTVSGLLHADHRLPSLSYESLLKLTLWLTKEMREGEKQFRHAAFNLLAHNRDDHAKNFSFIMAPDGVWKVSPAYDLTFSSGPAGEHCTSMMREGKAPGLKHLLLLAETVGIAKKRALEIIEDVESAVARWSEFAKEAGVGAGSRALIQKFLKT